MAIPAHKDKSLTINVTVYESGATKDITGATLTAKMRSPDGTTSDVTTDLTDAANGLVQLTIADDELSSRGEWICELAVTLGGKSQTVWQEPVMVRDSLI